MLMSHESTCSPHGMRFSTCSACHTHSGPVRLFARSVAPGSKFANGGSLITINEISVTKIPDCSVNITK